MISKISAVTLQGIDALPVEVEAGVYNGLPDLTVVGLPDAVLRESRERVRSAVVNAGYTWPARRMLVNLAPAHMRKEGSGLDLAVGVSLLKATGQLPELQARELVFVGELSLDGSLRATRGVLAAALSMSACPDKILVVPSVNLEEAVRGYSKVLALESLSQLRDNRAMEHMLKDAMDRSKLAERARNSFDKEKLVCSDDARNEPDSSDIDSLPDYIPDISSVKGQDKGKRALEIAATGDHHILLVGPPGSGKSMLARCLQGLLPPLDEDEALEVNRIYSAAGLLGPDMPWIKRRPFRSPHATVTKAGLLGGGQPFRPGEVSLAHRGALFIDELPEMDRNCVESLRQPLEEGEITLSRAWGSVTMPAKIQLIASANPCPCGFFGEYPSRCKCLDHEIKRYQNRFSGPLMDRVDLLVRVPRLEARNLDTSQSRGEDSRVVARKVCIARQRRALSDKRERRDINKLQDQLTREGKKWAFTAYDKYCLTARGYARMLSVARTIADLNDEDKVGTHCLAEALEYRLGFGEL